MKNPLLVIRNRFHPLHHLRKFQSFQALTRHADVPVPIRFPGVSHRMYVSLSKNLSWVLTGGASCEEDERAHFTALVRYGGFNRFLDIGANIGLYGFLFRALCPSAKVLMVEPDARNAELIRRTLKLAGAEDIALLEAAVSDASGSATFHVDDLTGATGSIEAGTLFTAEHHGQTPDTRTIRCVTLDEICPEGTDLIKIDVEGAELRVFRGALVTLTHAQPAIFFECDQHQDEVHSCLHGMGYTFFDFATMQPTSSIVHNTLALHTVKHAALIDSITGKKFVTAAAV